MNKFYIVLGVGLWIASLYLVAISQRGNHTIAPPPAVESEQVTTPKPKPEIEKPEPEIITIKSEGYRSALFEADFISNFSNAASIPSKINTFCDDSATIIPPAFEVRSAGGIREKAEKEGKPKLLIVSVHFNRADFIRIQYYSLKRFILDPFEYVVGNDAVDVGTADPHALGTTDWKTRISNECKSLGIKEVQIPQQETHHGDVMGTSERAGRAIQYMIDNVMSQWNGMIMLIDADMWFIKSVKISEIMDGYQVGTPIQTRGGGMKYFWNGLLIMDKPAMPDWSTLKMGCYNGDTGSASSLYWNAHPNIKVINLQGFGAMQDFTLELLSNFPPIIARYAQVDHELCNKWNEFQFLNGKIYHYRSGGAWAQKDATFHQRRSWFMSHYMLQYLLDSDQLKIESQRCGSVGTFKNTGF